jgi:hypothetical protein
MAIGFVYVVTDGVLYIFHLDYRKSIQNRNIDVWKKSFLERNYQMGICEGVEKSSRFNV